MQPLGKSTTSKQYLAPKFDYHEDTFSFIPHECTPSTGTTQKCTIDFQSHRRLLEDLVLNFKIKNTHNGNVTIHHPVRLIEQLTVYINNVEVLKHEYSDATFMAFMKNLYTSSFDSQDVKNKFNESSLTNTILPNVTNEYYIPIDYLASNIFHRFDTLQAKNLSIEIKWKSVNTSSEVCSMMTSPTDTNVNPYPKLQISDTNLIQKAVSYTSPYPYPIIGESYVKQLFKFEKKTFTADGNGNWTVKLADDFGYHSMILGVFAVNTQTFTNFGGTPQRVNLDLGCKLYHNGRLHKNVENSKQFWKQSNQFYKSLGASTTTDCSTVTEYTEFPVFSFLDSYIHNGSVHDKDHVEFFGGIANTKDQNYQLQFSRYNRGVTFNPSVDVYICYTEMLKIDNGRVRIIR